MWNWLSPFWDKIAESFYDKFSQIIVNKYYKISKKNRKIIISCLIILFISIVMFFTIYYINKTDISVVNFEIKENQNATVDINFILKNNNSESDRYISQVVIYVKDYYEMAYANSYYPLRLEPSYTYEVEIIGDNLPEKHIVDMSQVIPAGGFDSFNIKIASCEQNVFREILTRIEFEFICDNGEIIKTDECVLAIGCDLFDENVLQMNGHVWRSIYDNYIALKRFNNYNCKFVMDAFVELFQSYQMHEDKILKLGKEQYESDMLRNTLKINNLNYIQFVLYLTIVFGDYDSIDTEEINDNYLFTVNYKFNDYNYTIYFITDKSEKILSIYIPAKKSEFDHMFDEEIDFSLIYTPIHICNYIIQLIDPSINKYWYDQRVVDLYYHENLRFWNDDNIYAKFVNYRGKDMLKFDLK